MYEFNFGPISRTVNASTGIGDAINFASLPIHEVITALLAATNRDEFIAWLWHDLFKPLFWWPERTRWYHCPSDNPNEPLGYETGWSKATGIPPGLVATHHSRGSQQRCLEFRYREPDTIQNEFDQVILGRAARFLQLSFLAEPAMHTALLRAVIADAFMEAVTQKVAQAIETELRNRPPFFQRVHYLFEFQHSGFSNPPQDAEIHQWAGRYSIEPDKPNPGEMSIFHVIPTSLSDLVGQRIEVVVDLSETPPTQERFDQNIVSLVELLTVYQDSQTILMGIPHFLQVDLAQLMQEVRAGTEERLHRLDVRFLASPEELKKQARGLSSVNWSKLPLQRRGNEIDLLAHVFQEQLEIRQVGGAGTPLLLADVVARPRELTRNRSRRCRFCNTMFESAFPSGTATVGADFTDVEYIAFTGDICPMCQVYRLNSHKSRTPAERAQGITGDRKGYRGAFALIVPSSHFTYLENQCHQLEQPPLDVGGRFANPLQRSRVTLQEYNLFNMISRRIVARLWAALDPAHRSKPLPLPYLGAILLTQDRDKEVRALFDRMEQIFEAVELTAYPFRVVVQPAVEVAMEMAINDCKKHHTKHTYLKTNLVVVPVSPESKFTLVLDNQLQQEVSRQFFEDRRRLDEILRLIPTSARYSWLLDIFRGVDPLTAAMEALADQEDPLAHAEHFYTRLCPQTDGVAARWQRYREVCREIQDIVSRNPMLLEFYQKPKRKEAAR